MAKSKSDFPVKRAKHESNSASLVFLILWGFLFMVFILSTNMSTNYVLGTMPAMEMVS
jgi:hypothetical protein